MSTQPPPPSSYTPQHQRPSATQQQQNLSASSVTIPSDSENYDGNNELSSSALSPPESPSPSPPAQSPVILYTPPTYWSLLRGAAINLVLPFVNGLMLGFGELFAHEIAFRLGWSGTKVSCLFITLFEGR